MKQQTYDLRNISKKFEDKLKKIKVFILDVDGILTNGQIYYAGEEVGFNRSFHAQDGFGLRMLMKSGIKVGIISGGDSLGLSKRVGYLRLDYAFVGVEDKRDAYKSIKKEGGYNDSQMFYMGDELFDIPLLKRAGFSATVPHTSHEVQESVDYVTHRTWGDACVREVIDLLRYAQGIVPDIPDFDDI